MTMKFVILCSTLCLFLEASGEFTFTYKMASKCKEHLCQHGYSYETYYRVNPVQYAQDQDILYEMHIAILASSNGHVLLSSVPFPGPEDPVYEIVVGGGGNKFTELRRNLRRNAKTSAHTPGILSSVEFRAFHIKISEDGQIEFGKEGESLPLLTYFDTDPLAVKYFSFAAWNGVEAKFLYDCPISGENSTDESSPKSNSEIIERKISNAEKLKRTLLMDRQPSAPNSGNVDLNLGIKITNLRYDTMETKLITSLALVMVWTDDSLAWNIDKFNGTSKLRLRQGQIWSPDFIVLNSDDVGILRIMNPDPIDLSYSGEASLNIQTTVNTWCSGDHGKINKWPYDRYECYIVLSSWEVHENFKITLLKAGDERFEKLSGFDEGVINNWDMKYKMSVVTARTWNRIYFYGENQTSQGDKVAIKITLSRKGNTYYVVFFTPLFVLTGFVLLSFWSEPLKNGRVWFYASSVVIIMAGLCNLDYMVPCHTIPLILIFYIALLIGVILALMVQLLLMTSQAKRVLNTRLAQAVLTSRIFRLLFFLQPIKRNCVAYESFDQSQSNQENEDSIYTEIPEGTGGNLEELETEEVVRGSLSDLAEVVDKTMFFIYSLLYSFMFTRYS